MRFLNSKELLKLCKRYPLVEAKFIETIRCVKNDLRHIQSGSECHKYNIPNHLRRCKRDLEFLRSQRSRGRYNEFHYSPTLDQIEDILEKFIAVMEEIAQMSECNISKILRNKLVLLLPEMEAKGKDCSIIKALISPLSEQL